ncbi:SGNH/GDSL hydrolase family protein [uncultured Sphingomonas sp.]|uniref:SGNH/GDSL hydrolase family protein n=1 Tax=uncultured Sphingomonas sp. TaxID=158754 RepID=UPI0025ECF7CF|nr:SGNH/GDSL hydrolase family protein [uncultured Sphingomonas sp.]
MAKISLLPRLAAPTGAELVPVLTPDNRTQAAPIAGLVAGAVDQLGRSIGIEPARGGWQAAVVDGNGRVVQGFHPLLGIYDAARIDLEQRVRVQENGGGVAIPRTGGWIKCKVDSKGRVIEGVHELLGVYPAEADQTGTVNGAWAAKVAELRSLRLRSAAPQHPAPPKVVRRTLTKPLVTGAVTIIAHADPRLTFSLPMIAAGPNQEMTRAGWIQLAGELYAPHYSLRLVTDAPQLDVRYGYPGQLRMLVDGQPVSIGATLDLAEGEDDYPLICIDFGSDTRFIKPAVTLTAAGIGYAEGDVLTIPGAAGDPLQLDVTSINADGSLRARGLRVKSWGKLTALQAGPVAVTGGSGSGATIALDNNQGFTGHTTRRMRRIELIFAGGGGQTVIGDVRVAQNSTVRPWQLSGPRLMVMQDSYGQVFSDYPGGVWAQRMGELLGIEDVWLNTIGGTGFTAGSIRYAPRLGDIAAHLPPPQQPLIFLTQGSINDAGASVADLRAAVSAYWTEAFARLPDDAIMVQTGILRAPGSNPSDAQSAAVREGFAEAQAVADPGGKRSFFIETRAPLSMMVVPQAAGEWIAGDQAHPTQEGHDYIAGALASSLLRCLQSLAF